MQTSFLTRLTAFQHVIMFNESFPTHIKKIILPNIVEFFTAEFCKLYQLFADFCAEHSAAICGHVLVTFLIDKAKGNIRFARVF